MISTKKRPGEIPGHRPVKKTSSKTQNNNNTAKKEMARGYVPSTAVDFLESWKCDCGRVNLAKAIECSCKEEEQEIEDFINNLKWERSA